MPPQKQKQNKNKDKKIPKRRDLPVEGNGEKPKLLSPVAEVVDACDVEAQLAVQTAQEAAKHRGPGERVRERGEGREGKGSK
jgi:hypothetical protein